ncbi:hypothetical protein C1645_836215 [Glomus cerebriforme]|uniref:Uncharacterized protein n=1 Tax=Glomus cerebriforme TaxID=658196 RepID=A0A397SHF9_9GLOM|nr:hypothetical protein C1645_836215 [Glomus cerebriforme]
MSINFNYDVLKIDDLKYLIWDKKKDTFGDFNSSRINIWKVNIALGDIAKLKDVIEEQIKDNFKQPGAGLSKQELYETVIPTPHLLLTKSTVLLNQLIPGTRIGDVGQIYFSGDTDDTSELYNEASCLVPIVGDREIHRVENNDLFGQIDDASEDLMQEYMKKVPLSLTFLGKSYIIATMNLPKGTPVYNLPAEYKNFPVLIDYRIIKASKDSHKYRKYQDLKPGISISSYELGEAGNSIIQPGKMDNGNLMEHYCAKVTKYEDLSINASECLLDYFC